MRGLQNKEMTCFLLWVRWIAITLFWTEEMWYDTFWWALNLLYWLEMEVREEWKQRNHYKTKVSVENVLDQDGSTGGGKWSKSGYVLEQSCVWRCEWMWEK